MSQVGRQRVHELSDRVVEFIQEIVGKMNKAECPHFLFVMHIDGRGAGSDFQVTRCDKVSASIFDPQIYGKRHSAIHYRGLPYIPRQYYQQVTTFIP